MLHRPIGRLVGSSARSRMRTAARWNSTQSSQPSRFSKFIPRLTALSTRTGVPLPSLVLSFAVLHELTAIFPLLLFFFAFQAAGVGGSVVQWAAGVSERSQDE